MSGKGRSGSKFVIIILCSLISTLFLAIPADGQEDPLDREEQWFRYRDSPEIIEDGIFIDHVDERKYSYPDRHYYLIEVPDGRELSISIEKTDNGTGVLYLDTEFMSDRYYSDTDMMFLYLDDQGENRTDTWKNHEGEDVNILIEVQGVGEYLMVVDTTGDAGVNPETYISWISVIFIVIMMLFSVVVSMMYPMTILIVIIILVVSLSKNSRSRSKKKNRAPAPRSMEPQPVK